MMGTSQTSEGMLTSQQIKWQSLTEALVVDRVGDPAHITVGG
jgi:hypothetical protein